MKPTLYPDSFFIAHRLFTGAPFPAGGAWGDILDGPLVDGDAVKEAIGKAFNSDQSEMTKDNLRVWLVTPDKPAEDCTAWAVAHSNELLDDWTF